MKMFAGLLLGFCFLIPLSQAQVDEAAPPGHSEAQPAHNAGSASRGLGDLLWSIDVEGPTGDTRCLGVEFDGTNYWVTGAYDMNTRAKLYEIDPAGNVLNKYVQPSGNWGTWGWRDLAWDGTYLYAGDDGAKPGYITQIDPSNGQVTGINYGPFPVTPCRAMAYDPATDSFWTASWGSAYYNCYRDNSYVSWGSSGLSVYGMAIDESNASNHMLWIWSQDGNGCLASEWDPSIGGMTGVTFDGDINIGGIAGGACIYKAGTMWEFTGLHQASPDTIAGYELFGQSLAIDTDTIPESTGGVVNFTLTGGVVNANRNYLLLGGLTGTVPGIPLPGGLVVLPLNYDVFTGLVINLVNTPIFSSFMGALDGTGLATAQFNTLGPLPSGTVGLKIFFAYGINKPWDFVSNPVTVEVVP